MKDFLNQEIKVGDIVAHSQRTSNSAYLSLKVVTKLRVYEQYGRKTDQVKVKGFTTSKWHWDGEKGHHEEGLFMNDRGGFTEPDRLVVVTDKVDKELREFLQNETR